tara:strand:+ start:570 stop:2066 length:1497 start_codon:yes stop_codon:yes gene_type:complete
MNSNNPEMETIVRTQAQQVGPFTATNNNVDIRINGGQVVDMSKSYIECELRATIGGTPVAGAIYPVDVGFGVDNLPAYNVGLVRNCRLRSQNQGSLEDINRIDILRTNLNALTLSRDEKISLSFGSLAQTQTPAAQRYGLFLDPISEGAEPSRQLIPRVKIPLSQLFGLGEQSQLDLNRTGNLDFHLELNNTGDTQALNATVTNNNADLATLGLLGVQVASGAAATGANVPSNTAATKTIQLVSRYETLEDLPFFVNQHCAISFTTQTGDGAIINGAQNIESIAFERATGVITLTFPLDVWSAGAGGTLLGCACTPTYTGVTASVSIENVSMVTTTLNGVSPSGQNSYFTYDTEQLQVTAAPNFSQIFTLPPNCINYIALFPDDTTGGLYSQLDTLADYRNRLDDVQENTRPVKVDEPLYYEQLRRTLINGGMRLRDLNLITDCNKKAEDSITSGTQWRVIANATPQTQRNKILQMNISAPGGGVKKINVYKQLVKVL